MKKKEVIISIHGGVAMIAKNNTDAEIIILDWDNIREDEELEKLAICGTCGCIEESDEGFCVKGHDNWVEVRDFFQLGLATHVANAQKKLNLSRTELMVKIIMDNKHKI